MTDGKLDRADILELAKESQKWLIEEGDPFSGSDWNMMQIVRDYIELVENELPGLKIGNELYDHAYVLIGACDISNFLARCETAGKIENLEER